MICRPVGYGVMAQRTVWFGSIAGLENVVKEIGSWVAKARDTLAGIASVVVILGAIWAVVVFATGGLRPQDQVATETLSRRAEEVQASITTLNASLNTITAAIAAMPRPSDYAQTDSHLHALDQRVDKLAGDITDLRLRVERLSTQMDLITSHTTRMTLPPN